MNFVFFIMLIITNFYPFSLHSSDENFTFLDMMTPNEKYNHIRNITAEEETDVKLDFITISLGCNCTAAAYTRKYKLRNYAFPFDWCLTPFPTLYHYIENDFKDYFKLENLIPSSRDYFTDYMHSFFDQLGTTPAMTEYFTWVLDKKNGMIFNHDFPNNKPETIAQHYQVQYQKYMRRVERLYNVIKLNKHLYFIRYHNITKPEALDLYHLLKSKFYTSSFTLIVIGKYEKDFVEHWNLPGIKNFYCPKEDDLFWKKLCADISLGKFLN